MQQEYDWNLILKVSLPFSIIEGYIFYTNISKGLKWVSLIISLLLVGGIVYFKDKRKSNIFTAVGVVFLAALVIKFLKDFGFIR